MGQLGKKLGIKYVPGGDDHPNNVLVASAREGWPSRRATSSLFILCKGLLASLTGEGMKVIVAHCNL